MRSDFCNIYLLKMNGWLYLTRLSKGIVFWKNRTSILILPGPSKPRSESALDSLTEDVLPLLLSFIRIRAWHILLKRSEWRNDLL
jgi:hypothetical protein